MAFIVYCDNKGCCKAQAPMVNLETNEVECSECNKPIKSITEFAKKQMVDIGQIKRSDKRDKAFAVQCRFCNKAAPPKVDKNRRVLCSMCGKHLDYLSTPYVNTVLQYIKPDEDN